MVKKKFIDKKNSVTYNLVFRSTEDANDAPERVLDAQRSAAETEAAAIARHEASGRRYPPGHPLAWMEEEAQQGEMSEERRQELVELGFPDDGYDYLRHVRTLGHGAASLEGMAAAPSTSAAGGEERGIIKAEDGPVGPSVFVPANAVQKPGDDVALYDASQLTVMQTAAEEAEVAGTIGGVTAFAKPAEVARGVDGKELEELEAAMAALEAESKSEDGLIEGEGDLLDDFILAATEGAGEGGDAWSSDDDGSDGSYDSDDTGESYSGSEGEEDGEGKRPGRPGSIASTYWRDERTDRRNLLGVIDEGFEQLALEYDEDEIGELDDAADMGDIQGFADVSDFSPALDEFLQKRNGASGGVDADGTQRPKVHSFLKEEMEAYGFSDDDAEVAINAARKAIRKAEEEEALGIYGKVETETVKVEDPSRTWDCESVLSLRSNLYNHPGTITEPPSQRRQPGMIRLDKKGMPMGVLPRREFQKMEVAVAAAPPPERKKGETAEEKKARKNAVKEAKRDARVAKKELKTMYKEESVKAQRRVATAHVQPTVIL